MASVPIRELRFRFSRSSGKGGQNVNKLNTKATLHWDVVGSRSLPGPVRARLMERFRNRINAEGELVLSSQRFRERERNVADCVGKLQAMLDSVARAPRPRRPTAPSRGSVERRLAEKRVRAAAKRRRRDPAED